MSSRRNRISWICVAAFCAMSGWFVTKAGAVAKQPPTPAVKVATPDKNLTDAASTGLHLDVISNVADQASVEAVLIPKHLASRIFGEEVSRNYAVVELIVSNTDSKAALIVQSVFLDYSQWLLSGISSTTPPPSQLRPTQRANQEGQVASVESRLIRGELLDAQTSTKRNWTIRGLTALGTVGTAFAFPFSTDVIKGIGAFNGEVVPGASALWPDGTVNQINRISDVGFQTNKIIPKQSSDIMVAFFPVDRFLTPTLRKMFMEQPAGLFVPVEMLADPRTSKAMLDMIGPLAQAACCDGCSVNEAASGQSVKEKRLAARQALLAKMVQAATADCTEDAKPACPADPAAALCMPKEEPAATAQLCSLKKLVAGLSLNRIRVVVGGVMSVDVLAIPATIYVVAFDSGSALLNTATQQKGTITGLYLSGGVLSLVDDKGKAIVGISVVAVADGASDTQLPFTMTVPACLDSSKLPKMFMVVTKPPATGTSTKAAPKNSGVQSTPFEIEPAANVCPAKT